MNDAREIWAALTQCCECECERAEREERAWAERQATRQAARTSAPGRRQASRRKPHRTTPPVIVSPPEDTPFVPPQVPSWDSPQRPGLWARAAPHVPETRPNTFSGFTNHDPRAAYEETDPTELLPSGEILRGVLGEFRSPDGRVWVDYYTLYAYGHTLPLGGGSWAACRDADGGPVVLHEYRETVSVIRPSGRETCTRTEFEEGVLRRQAGAFRRFSPVGNRHHSWPDMWAFAECWPVRYDGESREEGRVLAITGEVPWRDRVGRIGAGDLGGYLSWLTRPRRRPAPDAPAPLPRAPLGLTRADVLEDVQFPDPWPRGYGPARLPVAVSAGEAGAIDPEAALPVTVSAGKAGAIDPEAALAAIRKRYLYPPAGWPEELDDRTRLSLRGGVTVTFEEIPLPSGPRYFWLLLRAREGAETLNVNGAEVNLHRLGSNAPQKGWHPYVAALPFRASVSTLTLTAPFAVSRLLLVERVLSETFRSGGDAN